MFIGRDLVVPLALLARGVVILLPPLCVAERRSLLVVYFSFWFYIIVYQTICPSGPPWNEGHRPNGSSRDQML